MVKRNNEVVKLGRKLKNLLLILGVTAVLLLTYKLQLCNILLKGFLINSDKDIQYHRNMPLIIIGGVHRSGAGLLRAMLDAHSDVRCDEEIFVNSMVLNMFQRWRSLKKETLRLDQAGVSEKVLDAAVAAFCLETIALEGEPTRQLCTNSRFMLTSADHVSRMFPQAKFILVVRDGRAVVHSIISHQFTFNRYNISDTRETLKIWNTDVSTMYNECKLVGHRRCMLVHYEQLVLHPESLMRQILSFLEVPWDESVLHHETKNRRGFVLKKGNTSDPVEGPINVDALTKWVDQFPLDVMQDMSSLAPMLVTLGYDPRANSPNYGTLDKFLLHSEQDDNERLGTEITTNIFRNVS